MKKITIIIAIVLAIIGIIALGLFCQLSNIEIRQTKDYAEMYVDETDILDYSAIVSPPEKYSQLLQLNMETREKLSEYMKKNNFKLKSGKQEFVRNNPSLDELINDGFIFEKMEDWKSEKIYYCYCDIFTLPWH